ncbi:flavodoxin-dependent (E)-4-hydroxy-3-methylbut-2-enyl-diphosphate synthase [Desulfitibacter alkalitolerans]|uniref:flavodoxin-dependent (E)-4-hydroxy-3-methylbut-2-enyl-diphosphate synthase n=1 Tax=Desulfitibacter alkalitolerans TaxID=264641 RepID=UPI0004852F51|nr:flavodoxin-dependent (E)-4-hydroxy-3-methylbut-2-enyl-diphosphate synthase [Desulfitibacter alkalitolerans]
MRRKSKVISVGNVCIGGNNPIVVQSMTNTDTRDISSTVKQINNLSDSGCELVRVAVINQEAALAIREIKAKISIPLIADIHFDYRLALQSIESGADGLRLNPGNIGSIDAIKRVVFQARERSIPIRIGVNSGSLEKDILKKYGTPTADALVESALRHVRILENLDYDLIKISVKSSDVKLMVEGYRLLAKEVEYPLHLGVTEAGTVLRGTVKSAVGLGILLSEGIGDTIRVSLTGPPETEVFIGYEILSALGLRKRGLELISCPTCGRCQVNLIAMAEEVERRLAWVDKPIKVAVMGCPVNGPGEAKHCDVGIAGGNKKGLVFRKGKIIANAPQEKLVDLLEEEIKRMLGEGD